MEKDLPHSRDAEMMVLGCMLSQQHAFKTAALALGESDFYFQEHVLIFQAILRLYRGNRSCEVYLAAEELRTMGRLDEVGGVAYLVDLAQFAGTSSSIGEYIEILKSKAIRRQAYHLFEEGRRQIFSENLSFSNLIEKKFNQFSYLERRYLSPEQASIADVLSGGKSRMDSIPLIDRIGGRQEYFKNYKKPFMTGVPSGFSELDREATILEETNLIVVAARPAMGKTAFAINIANHVCVEQRKPVAIFSLEMGADQLAERFLSLRSGISGEQIKRGELSDSDMACLKLEESNLRSAKLFIIDSGCSKISQIIAKARKLKEEEDISLFVIDYIQLMQSDSSSENRQYEIADISRRLKLLAMELKTPCICISQLSRKVEDRRGHRPMMSDLRDSGQIEQDSDVVIFIHRKEYYDPQDHPGEAELIVAKNRNGATPSIPLYFDGKCGKFSSHLGVESSQTKPRRAHRINPFLAGQECHPLLR